MNNDESKTQLASSAVPVSEVKRVGQIGSLTLPPGFVEGEQDEGPDGSVFKQYELGSDSDIKLYFEYRGFRIKRKYGEQFIDLLAKPAHEIDKNKIYDYSPVLADQSIAEDFEITQAKTIDLDSRRVLVVEGNYPKFKIKARTMYIDTDGTGSAIQQVTFQAPYKKADQYFPSGIEALESITWR